MDADPTGGLLRTSVLPFYRNALDDEDARVRALAARKLGELGLDALRADPTGALWKKELEPLFEQALADPDKKVRSGAAESFQQMGVWLWRPAPPELLFSVVWMGLHDRAFGGGAEIEAAAQESLSTLARGSLGVDPSGEMLERDVLPLFERGLSEEDARARERVSDALIGLESALEQAGLGAMLARIRPRYDPARTYSTLDASYNYGRGRMKMALWRVRGGVASAASLRLSFTDGGLSGELGPGRPVDLEISAGRVRGFVDGAPLDLRIKGSVARGSLDGRRLAELRLHLGPDASHQARVVRVSGDIDGKRQNLSADLRFDGDAKLKPGMLTLERAAALAAVFVLE
jgi:hypothetical protein